MNNQWNKREEFIIKCKIFYSVTKIASHRYVKKYLILRLNNFSLANSSLAAAINIIFRYDKFVFQIVCR